ncbi:MAG: hypothetical protein ACP5NS_02015 [Candidatus Pacearchaeota archaeon]
MISRRDFSKLAVIVGATAMLSPSSLFSQDSKPASRPSVDRQYAVVVSKSTYQSPGWKGVVDALKSKYPETQVHVYGTDIAELSKSIALQDPTHIAYVAKPEEVAVTRMLSDEGRELTGETLQEDLALLNKSGVGKFHKFLYGLGNGYPTAIGGIITGYSAEDAKKLANARPYAVKNGLLKTMAEEWAPIVPGKVLGFSDTKSDEGNGTRSLKVYEGKDGKVTLSRTDVAGERFFKEFNNKDTDLIMVNGHASDHDWRSGHGYPDDQMTVKDGKVVMINPQGVVRGELNSANQKVFWSPGSCQLGRIKDSQNSLVLALARDAGVVNHFGYANNTWHGYVGGGLRDPLIATTEPTTFFEALHLSRVSAEYERSQLQKRRESEGLGPQLEEFGKVWDKTGFVGFGDPALEVRMKHATSYVPELDKRMIQTEKGLVLSLEALRDTGGGERPVVFRLPRGTKVGSVKASEGLVYEVVGNRYVIVEAGRELIETDDEQLKYRMVPVKKGTKWTVEINK